VDTVWAAVIIILTQMTDALANFLQGKGSLVLIKLIREVLAFLLCRRVASMAMAVSIETQVIRANGSRKQDVAIS